MREKDSALFIQEHTDIGVRGLVEHTGAVFTTGHDVLNLQKRQLF